MDVWAVFRHPIGLTREKFSVLEGFEKLLFYLSKSQCRRLHSRNDHEVNWLTETARVSSKYFPHITLDAIAHYGTLINFSGDGEPKATSPGSGRGDEYEKMLAVKPSPRSPNGFLHCGKVLFLLETGLRRKSGLTAIYNGPCGLS